MEDFFGKEMIVGDAVVFRRPGVKTLMAARIVGFTKKRARLAWTNRSASNIYLVDSKNVVVVPDESYVFYSLKNH
jgi:hypothetical protein